MKAAIFDFNGTMIFDEKFHNQAWRIFAEQKTGRDISDEEFQEYVHGRSCEDILSHFLNRPVARDEALILEEEKEKIYRNLCLSSPEEFKLADGLAQFLDLLKENKLPFTIATASGLNNVRFFFKNLGLERWFDFESVVYNDGMIPGKPEPDIYLKASEKLDMDVEECAVFEDARSGIKSAKSAGAGLIIGITSMLDEKQLLLCGADFTIKNYLDAERLYNYVFG